MQSTPDSFRLAAVQSSAVFLDRDATLAKACRLVEDAARNGATLVAFPEAFVSGYPLWVWFIPPGRTHELRSLYAALVASSVAIPDRHVERLAQVAGDCKVTVAIGVNERNTEGSNTTLYNTLLYLGPEGTILGKHRKLIPTAAERLVWGGGSDAGLDVYPLPFGRLSGLICWENYMPLARYALAAAGEQVHVAPTWDRGEPWTSTMRHIAKESRCFVLSVCQPFHKDDIPDALAFKQSYLSEIDGWVNPGMSLIVDPDGKILAGPLVEAEEILYADVDPRALVGPRWQLDIAGHYARPDIFELRVRRGARPLVVDDADREGGFEPT